MADLWWMKFWPGNYLGDTGHLSLAEHGAYLLMLCFAWDNSTCSIPADPKWIKRRLRVDDEEYDCAVQPVIEEFWTEEAGWLHQKRQRKEFFEAKASAERRAKSARKAAEVRWGVDPLKGKGFPDA
jgi:uncharacterized protein YdaU (DUF1376 family)